MATYNGIKKIKIGNNIFNLYDSGNSGGTITSIKTTAGAHTAINVTSGAVSFKVPTKTSHLTNDSGFITTDTNTTYALSGALSSHKFTSTLTAGGSGSGTSTSALTLAAGSNVTLTDNTSTKTITIAATDTKYSAGAGLSLSSTTFSSLNSNLLNGSAIGSVRGVGTAAEGSDYTMGEYAFAEGLEIMARGHLSHAQNHGTIANGLSQTTLGEFNIPEQYDANNDLSRSVYAVILGNGTGDAARSNALAIDWHGNIHTAGTVYTNANSDSTGGTPLTPSVELTQAEYDALTEAEKNNGTVYFITDGISQNEIASYSNQVLSLGNLRIYKGYKLVSNTGRSSITFPSGTFSQVLWAISFCDQPGFGGYDTTSVTELTTSKVTLYQYNSAGANMNVGVVVFGLA